ncbi:MAG: TetR/AcrR family transcriptional regulator [Alphaproteobacteria bacterium]|nr:TetR/AcrR family transcriptional regulator [Alphaproteobacteria bacterium]
MSEALSRRAERRTRQRASNRAAILDAARRIAAQQGAGNLSLRSVAAEAGYAPASVYEYFHNRAELVLALASDDLSVLARELRDRKQSEAPVKAAAVVVLEFLRHNRALPAAALSLASHPSTPEVERLFNGKVISALTGFAEAAGLAPVSNRNRQAEIVLAVAALIGLSVLARSGRLSALSLDTDLLVERLAALHSPR